MQENTIQELQENMSAGCLTSRRVVEQCLERIDTIDELINSIIQTNPDALSHASAAVAGYPHITVPAGFLFGLPIGLSFFSSAWRESALIKLIISSSGLYRIFWILEQQPNR